MVEEVTGTPVAKFLEIAETFCATGVPDKVGNIVYAVGLTHHTQGSQMIRAAAIVQLLLGNVGRPGGGLNAERGHANIQGNTDNAQSWDILPGYLAIPRPGVDTIDQYVDQFALTPLDPDAINYFGTNYRKFLVSLLKAWYGDRATAANDYLSLTSPSPQDCSWMTYYDEALAAVAGLFNSGMSSVNIGPDSNRVIRRFRTSMVRGVEPFPTASSDSGTAVIDPVPCRPKCSSFRLAWIAKSGAFVNSGAGPIESRGASVEGDVRDTTTSWPIFPADQEAV